MNNNITLNIMTKSVFYISKITIKFDDDPQTSSIVYYAPRGRKRTLLTSTENTGVDKVPLPRGAYAIFYNTCVISDVF